MADLEKLYEAILTGKLEIARAVTNEAIAENVDPHLIINNYMSRAMEDIGKRFEEGKAFVPELLMAARAMKGALDLLKPQMKGAASHSLGKVVIGTVKGDLHDIGKNLVSMIAEGNGYEVIDLGVDVPAEKFIEAIKMNPGAFVGMSALLTTTMANMEKINKIIKSEFPEVITCVGGAPLNNEFAKKIGADYYTDEPQALVEILDKLVA